MYQTEIESNFSNIKKETAIVESLAVSILETANMNGKSYLKSCESFLKKNIDDYPLFANSEAYDDTGSIYDIEGSDKIGII